MVVCELIPFPKKEETLLHWLQRAYEGDILDGIPRYLMDIWEEARQYYKEKAKQAKIEDLIMPAQFPNDVLKKSNEVTGPLAQPYPPVALNNIVGPVVSTGPVKKKLANISSTHIDPITFTQLKPEEVSSAFVPPENISSTHIDPVTFTQEDYMDSYPDIMIHRTDKSPFNVLPASKVIDLNAYRREQKDKERRRADEEDDTNATGSPYNT